MKSKINYKKIIIDFLKGEAVKLALKRFLGSAIIGGFKAWIIAYIVKELFDEIAEPLIKASFNQLGYLYDRVDGKLIIKKIEEARRDNDAQAYRDNVNDIFN